MRDHADELLADFQEVYHMNLWVLGLGGDSFPTRDLYRIAALAYQLPPTSRVRRAIEPAKAHDQTVRLLRQIEYNQRMWHWAHTKDAKDESTAPEPHLLPGEEEAYERAVAHAEDEAARTAEALGIKL